MNFITASCILNVAIVGGELGPISKTDDKIRSFGALQIGWHYGKGGPARQDIIRVARAYLWQFMALGFAETDAFPGADGEIMVTCYRGKHCVEVTVELDKSFVVTHQFDGQDRRHEAGLSRTQACFVLGEIVSNIEQEECAISALSTSDTMTPTQDGSRPWPSVRPAMAAVPPSFWSRAELLQMGQSAPTSNVFTGASAVNQPYFGGSMIRNLRQNAA